jgi:hypothetical protein
LSSIWLSSGTGSARARDTVVRNIMRETFISDDERFTTKP